ncbi:DUF4097 family beta strand repeat-containing protein [Actinomycetota bacterium Odt1-20B]
MPQRTFESSTTGPVVLGLSLPVGHVDVAVSESHTTARVVLSTEDSTGPAADAVQRTRSEQTGQALGIEVPEMPGDVIVQSYHGGRVVQSVGTVYGSVTGMTIVNGRIVSGRSSGMLAVSPIEATVYLPAGSSLAVVSTSADAKVHGDVERLEFRSVSGDLIADGARELSASTTSGDVDVARVSERVSARSVSGDIDVAVYGGHVAELKSTSGDVALAATAGSSGTVRARSVSGDVRLSGARHLAVSANSVSGHVRNR